MCVRRTFTTAQPRSAAIELARPSSSSSSTTPSTCSTVAHAAHHTHTEALTRPPHPQLPHPSFIPACRADVHRVIDLCAAPGGWSEVVSQALSAAATATHCHSATSSTALSPPFSGCCPSLLIAVDLAPISPIPGVVAVQADLSLPSTVHRLLQLLQAELADLVLCDAAPDVVHQPDLDEYIQHQLTLSALHVCAATLRRGGTFVAKMFRGGRARRLLTQCGRSFDDVVVAKPRASRNSSIEAFLVCRGYRGSEAAAEATLERARPVMDLEGGEDEGEEEEGDCGGSMWRFVSCSDAMALDADQTYPLSFRLPSSSGTAPPYVASLAPSALPIDPPYQTALRLQRQRLTRKQQPRALAQPQGSGQDTEVTGESTLAH